MWQLPSWQWLGERVFSWEEKYERGSSSLWMFGLQFLNLVFRYYTLSYSRVAPVLMSWLESPFSCLIKDIQRMRVLITWLLVLFPNPCHDAGYTGHELGVVNLLCLSLSTWQSNILGLKSFFFSFELCLDYEMVIYLVHYGSEELKSFLLRLLK